MTMVFRPLLAALILILSGGMAEAAPAVVTTIKPVHALAAAVMDGVGTPSLLIQGAASEHSYVMKPSDAAMLAHADVVFWIGPDLETFLAGPLEHLASHAQRVALETSPGLTLLAARPAGIWTGADPRVTAGAVNPHIWLDPGNAAAMVRAIAAALVKADPASRARYQANAAAEILRLSALDRELTRVLAPVSARRFLVFHDAYAYFTAHYHLAAAGAVTVEPERPVSPRRVAGLRAALARGDIVCLFREPQFPPALIGTLAEGNRVRIGELDPIGAGLPPGPALYPALMRGMARALHDCLAHP